MANLPHSNGGTRVATNRGELDTTGDFRTTIGQWLRLHEPPRDSSTTNRGQIFHILPGDQTPISILLTSTTTHVPKVGAMRRGGQSIHLDPRLLELTVQIRESAPGHLWLPLTRMPTTTIDRLTRHVVSSTRLLDIGLGLIKTWPAPYASRWSETEPYRCSFAVLALNVESSYRAASQLILALSR